MWWDEPSPRERWFIAKNAECLGSDSFGYAEGFTCLVPRREGKKELIMRFVTKWSQLQSENPERLLPSIAMQIFKRKNPLMYTPTKRKREKNLKFAKHEGGFKRTIPQPYFPYSSNPPLSSVHLSVFFWYQPPNSQLDGIVEGGRGGDRRRKRGKKEGEGGKVGV